MKSKATAAESKRTAGRVASLDWETIATELDVHGSAVIGPLLTPGQRDELAASYEDEGDLRTALYPPLAEVANRWNEEMEIEDRYPTMHKTFLDRCHVAGQTKPTPLLLRYETGDYNALH